MGFAETSPVKSGQGKEITFYKGKSIVASRAMTNVEYDAYKKINVASETLEILNGPTKQTDADLNHKATRTAALSLQLAGLALQSKETDEDLKNELKAVAQSLEFDASAPDSETATLENYALHIEKMADAFKKEIADNSDFEFDKIKINDREEF
jgi:hypothetical protein